MQAQNNNNDSNLQPEIIHNEIGCTYGGFNENHLDILMEDLKENHLCFLNWKLIEGLLMRCKNRNLG